MAITFCCITSIGMFVPRQLPAKIDFTFFTLDAATQSVVHLEGKLFHVELQFDWPLKKAES